ncbi:MAG: hypothetical protein UV73_C0004G0027 [Candidatus Gottesmanbacteria bacterium GW2011_GWA2_43_14]|uniref:Yip1 domain-containing protein n=1 Tax=Candidatus Gottesmanbacteria bacterium GW2011_GWA2_43_14 TaxID=1618443 RepID=A0A0G1DJ39_9BACT|nr:MAG: hypothetical protein UV73_C0004G0027 [Candidatus Gottesmanbacteria bacterium GW2011_GWA2_43_14]
MRPITSFVFFLRNSFGIIKEPYHTYRHLAHGDKIFTQQTIYIYLLVIFFFLSSSIIRLGMENPYLLTVRFNLLLFGTAGGIILMLFLFYLTGKLWQVGNFSLLRLTVLWSYSLWPTLLWFIATALLYRLIPPPRTWSVPGGILSIIFITYSLTLLSWKLILYYLTLRFGLKLDLARICLTQLLIVPVVFIYSFILYKSGIFRIPFI